MYRDELCYYESLAESYPTIDITVSSIKFDTSVASTGTIKFFSSSKNCQLLYDPKWNEAKECYDWKNAADDNHVFVCRFKLTKDGRTFVMLPGKYSKVKNDAGEWIDKLDADGNKIWRDQILLLDRLGFNRIRALKAILTAMIDAKAGRFKYAVDQETDHFFAYRKVLPGEETASGYKGIRHEDVEKLRDQGIKVYTRPSIKSCSNCSNCVRLWEDDSDEDGVPGLPSRPVSELVAEGPVQPCSLCLSRKEFVDIDAADYINEISKEDRDSYVSNGIRRKARYDQVVIDRYVYGSRDVLVSQHWEGDEEDGEPVKEYIEEDYDDVLQVAMSYEEIRAMRMATIAEECPMWTKVDKDYGYYEWPKPEKVALLSYNDGEWIFCDTDKKVKTAGKQNKLVGRFHGIEATYFKKSPLERQHDFLGEVSRWYLAGADLSDKKLINKFMNTFLSEDPVKSLKEEWIKAAALLCAGLRVAIDTDESLKASVKTLVAKLLSNN